MTNPHRPGAAAADDAPAVEVRHALGPGDLRRATSFLDAAEAAAGVPLVDEAERERLEAASKAAGPPREGWRPLLAERDQRPVGYAAVVVPDDPGATAVGDLAVHGDAQLRRAVRSALFDALVNLRSDVEAARLQVWMRHVTTDDLRGVEDDGFDVSRRLAILGRRLDAPVDLPPAGELTVRAYRPDVDDAAVVEVLAAAYAGTDDGGWTLARFHERRELPWFRAEDLLLAEAPDGRVLGLHWLKRRDPTVGEVYNLAVHPDGQGRGLGPLLLAAGLSHLRSVGCDEVLLWVDRANERAVRLYTDSGFTTRWDDIALEHPRSG